MKVRILLIGSGGREHAIAKVFKKSSQLKGLFCFAEYINTGIKKLCEGYKLGRLDDIETICQWAVQQRIDFAFIGSEIPLAAGLADVLEQNKIATIGPCKLLAQIETSKGFARDLLNRYVPDVIPRYKKFSGMDGAKDFLRDLGDNFVIKADGLFGGKGVRVSQDHLVNHDEALQYCQKLCDNNQHFLLEDKLIGQEFSLLSFSDGKELAHMPIVKDYKRAFCGDNGPNTGSMGSYTDINHVLPFLSIQDVQRAQYLNGLTINALVHQIKKPYKGILYGSYILTKDGVKVIEYNARFGDPEAINILFLLQSDLITICQAIINSTLHELDIRFAKRATVCKYVVPSGYPDNPIGNAIIDFSAIEDQDNLYYASINEVNGQLYTTNSRALAVMGIGNSLEQAEQEAETIAQKIKGPLFYRYDIGKKP